VTGLAAIVVLGAAAQWLAWRTRLTSILLLLPVGFLVGPEVAGIVDPDALFGDLLFPLVSLCVALLLFEGGLSLNLHELKEHGPVVRRLVTIGALVTWALATVAAMLLLGFDLRAALLLGALLTVTGPTVVLPLLRQIRPTGGVGPILKWEGILIDPIGAVLAVLVLEGITGASAGDTVMSIVQTIVIGGGIGVFLAWGLSVVLERYWLPDYLHVPFALAATFGGFAAANAVQHEAGLLTVTLMGVYLANQKRTSVRHILEFKETVRDLLIPALFIILSARLRLADLALLDWGAVAFLLVLVLVARPLSVLASVAGSTTKRAERLFMMAMAPRGIVAASVASIFALRLEEHGYDGARALVPATFVAIVGTVVVYGLAGAPIARRLGLAVANPQGVLIVGAQEWARELAICLKDQGLGILMVDTNGENIKAARMAGIPAVRGNILREETEDKLDLAGLGRLFALTQNDEVNALCALHHLHLFGRKAVYQLAPAAGDEVSPHLRGRYLPMTCRQARNGFRSGARPKATLLTEQFTMEQWVETHGEDAVPLLRISKDGKVTVATSEAEFEAGPGDTLVGLVSAAGDD